MNNTPVALAIALAICSMAAQAQYKCTINGKTVYADAPCARDAKPVGALEDSVSQQQQIDRLKQSIKERQARNSIESGQQADYRATELKTANQNATEAAMARANEVNRKRKCANLEYDMQRNQRNIALGQDVGWQRTITQHENELKQRRDTYDHECR